MSNLEMMRKRLEYQGGLDQESRMIKGKWWTLQRALKYSYQSCTVQKVQPFDKLLSLDSLSIDEKFSPYRALINPDKVKQDYDDKILSIDYDSNYNPGDVFTWKNTDTYWIIYTQELTEDAYFRGEIRRCRYVINFRDKDGNEYSTWAAIRGPVETQINSIQKNQERIDRPNLSLNILIPRNEHTLCAFDRYEEFLFAGRCWRVEASDSISMSNIIEINAEEDYINRDTDDIEKELKNGRIKITKPTIDSPIRGEGYIIPLVPEIYEVDEEGGEWYIAEKDAPVTICERTVTSAKVTWNKMVKGDFTLQWVKGDKCLEKPIKVNSLY